MKDREYGYIANWNWIVISVIVMTVCTLLVLYVPQAIDFDGIALKALRDFLSPYPSYIPLFFSEFGLSYNLFWPVFAACCALLSGGRYIKAFLFVFFSQFALYTNLLIKNMVCRARPCGEAYSGFSFPSGHAATVTCVLGMAIYLILHYVRNKFWRYFLTGFFGLYIFMVCLSRLWLNHHFPIDVIAGFFLGLLCVNLYIILCKFFSR